MRLVNTGTGHLHEFFEAERPQYAVLSHTWGNEELSYLDLLYLTSDIPASSAAIVQALLRNPSRDRAGFRKLQECCKLARSRGVEWIWVDTCCIDKSSSAELSEAINSMYSWYQDAVECYVYLFDISTQSSDFAGMSVEDFGKARWFTRGWTLQELLAPKDVLFCNNQWEPIATKTTLARALSRITGIPLIFLDGSHSPTDDKMCSVATRMSWLSRRQTTRIEDMAYCMLGLFTVNMPLIYGEGRKAFMRLQLEIIKKSDDDSIYAWNAAVVQSGLLALWPTAFANSGNIVQYDFPDDPSPWLPPIMTSNGLEMRGRYLRQDPQQAAVDRKHGVHTISMAVRVADESGIVMFCGPCKDQERPVTQIFNPGERALAVMLDLRRFGATWQRVNCNTRRLVNYTMEVSSDVNTNAYIVYYIAQQGL